jgi:hypothetical protein
MKNVVSHTVYNILSTLPKKILENRNYHIIQECILYEIAHEECFNFLEVAYFIYNPDFHICKGIAGISDKDFINNSIQNHWHRESEFEKIIEASSYNKSIKSTQFCTLFSEYNIELIVKEIQKSIGLDSIDFFSWNTTHNNIGILLYHTKLNSTIEKDILQDAAALLSFCPIN